MHADAWRALGAEGYVTSLAGAEEIAEEYGFELVSDVDTLIGLVDIVDIVTPSSTHADFALRAIERGRDVICEKPLAATVEAATAVARGEPRSRACDSSPPTSSGTWRVRADQGRHRRRAHRTLAVQRFSRAGSAPQTPWFFSESTGGGVIRDLMIHDIDQAVWFAGPVATVFAVQNPPTVDDRVPAPVTAHVVLTHRSGVISHLHASWVAPGMPFRTSVEVAGSEGRLRYDSAEDASLRTDAVLDAGATRLPAADVARREPLLRRDRRLRGRAARRPRRQGDPGGWHRGGRGRRGRLCLDRRRRPRRTPHPDRTEAEEAVR